MAATRCRCAPRPTPRCSSRAIWWRKARKAGFPTICRKGAKLGYDPWLHTANGVAHLRQAAEKAGGTLVACDSNPIDAVWTDQPGAARQPGRAACLQSGGRNQRGQARRGWREGLKKAGADAAVITLADSVCWLFNIRGSDVPHTPFALAFAILNADGSADLFLDEKKRSPN